MKLASLLRLFALIGVVAAGLLTSDGGYDILILAALCIACLDATAAATARNVVVVYYFLVLGIGPYAIQISDAHRMQRFGVLLISAYLVGILARRVLRRAASTVPPVRPAETAIFQAPAGSGQGNVLLKLALFVQASLVLQHVVQYGLVGFLSGASLAGNITSYAAGGGLTNTQILGILSQALTASFVAVYIQVNEPERRYNWRLLIVLLIVMPLIGLQRVNIVVGVIVLLFLRRWALQTRKKRVTGGVAVVLLSLIVAAVAGVGIGLLRTAQLDPGGSSASTSQSVLQGELAPVIVIDRALAPEAPRYHGAGLYSPLLFRYVPRRLDPSKAPNTTVRYMQLTDPASFAAGYSLAPTAIGVIVLNYGVLGAYLLAFVAGCFLGGPNMPRPSRVGYVCAMYFALYSLIRNDPVNSIWDAGAILIGYWTILRVYHRHTQRRPKESGAQVAVAAE